MTGLKAQWFEIHVKKVNTSIKKTINITKDWTLWEIIDILFNRENSDIKVKEYFKSRIFNLLDWDIWETLRNNETTEEKWKTRKMWSIFLLLVV